MSNDADDIHSGAPRLPAFHHYADAEDGLPDAEDDLWADDAEPLRLGPASDPDDEAPTGLRATGPWVLGLVALIGAGAAGAVILAYPSGERTARPAPAKMAAAGPDLPVELAAPVPPPEAPPGPRLEVLTLGPPPERAAPEPEPEPQPEPESRLARAERTPPQEARSVRGAAASALIAPTPPMAPRARSADLERDYRRPPPPERSADGPCDWTRSLAQRMVCEDGRLAAADARLNRAYQDALDAGMPAYDLAVEQDDWLAIREEAARHSRRALASVYRQRIGELEAMADDR